MTETQKQIVAQAKEEMGKLIKLGFTQDVVPPDIEFWQVRLLVAQRLVAEGDYAGSVKIITEDLEDIIEKRELEAFTKFAEITNRSIIWEHLFEAFLSTVNREQKNRSAQKKWEVFDK